METLYNQQLVLWLIGAIMTLLGGCWAIFKYFEGKINRVYVRMDEEREQYYKDFLMTKVYDSEMKMRKENIDQRFVQIVELFNEKIDGLKQLFLAQVKNNNHT